MISVDSGICALEAQLIELLDRASAEAADWKLPLYGLAFHHMRYSLAALFDVPDE